MTQTPATGDSLVERAIAMSDALHYWEEKGVEIPDTVDLAWERLSEAIEAARSETGKPSDEYRVLFAAFEAQKVRLAGAEARIRELEGVSSATREPQRCRECEKDYPCGAHR